MASITGWKWRWPNITAPSMTSSLSSLASDSTISTASAVPATTRSSWRVGHLVERRVEHVFAVDEADAGGADRAHERGARQRQRGRGRDQRQNVGIVLKIVRQRGDDDLRFAAPAVGEQRTDRAIDQARNQRFLFGRTAFTLEVAAGNAAGGVIFFLVVDGQRQEVDAFARLLGGDDGGEHGGLAVAGEHGAVGLTRDFAGLEDERTPTPIEFNSMNIKHCVFLSWFSASALKAMSKTARDCAHRRVMRDANSVWRSCHDFKNIAVCSTGRTFRPVPDCPAAPSPPDS